MATILTTHRATEAYIYTSHPEVACAKGDDLVAPAPCLCLCACNLHRHNTPMCHKGPQPATAQTCPGLRPSGSTRGLDHESIPISPNMFHKLPRQLDCCTANPLNFPLTLLNNLQATTTLPPPTSGTHGTDDTTDATHNDITTRNYRTNSQTSTMPRTRTSTVSVAACQARTLALAQHDRIADATPAPDIVLASWLDHHNIDVADVLETRRRSGGTLHLPHYDISTSAADGGNGGGALFTQRASVDPVAVHFLDAHKIHSKTPNPAPFSTSLQPAHLAPPHPPSTNPGGGTHSAPAPRKIT